MEFVSKTGTKKNLYYERNLYDDNSSVTQYNRKDKLKIISKIIDNNIHKIR